MARPWERVWGEPAPPVAPAAAKPWERSWAAPSALPPVGADTLPPEAQAGPPPASQPAVDPMQAAIAMSRPAPVQISAQEDGADLLKRRGQEFSLGAADMVSAAIRGAAAMQASAERGRNTMEARDEEIRARDGNIGIADITGDEFVSGVEERAAAMPRTAAQDRPLFGKAGQFAAWARDTVGVPPQDDSFWSKFASGAGSFAAFMAAAIPASATGPVGMTAVGGTFGAAANSGQIYQEALDNGASDDQALDAAGVGRVVGATEVLPILDILKSLDKAFPELKSKVIAIAGKALRDASEEGLQEGLSQVANNLIASGYYDPERGWSDGVTENMLIGFALGGVASGTVSAVTSGAKPPEAGPEAPPAPAIPANPQQPRPDLPVTQDQLDSPIQTQLLQEGQAIIDAAVAGQPIPLKAPAVEAIPSDEAAVLFAAGYDAENITDMSPEERAAEVADARDQGVTGIDPGEAQQRVSNFQASKVGSDRTETSKNPQASSPAVAAPAAPEATSSDEIGAVTANAAPVAPNADEAPGDIVSLDPSRIKTDAARFQFKEGGDAQGVTASMVGTKKWSDEGSGIAVVWEDLKGERFIVDGHQRLGLAQRLQAEGQKPRLRALILREKDGVTADDAMQRGAIKNLQEGGESTSALDIAKVFKRGGTTEAVRSQIPPNRKAYRDGLALAKLGDEAFNLVVNDRVPAAYAADVGREIQGDAPQLAALGYLAANPPSNAQQARIIIGQMKAEGFVSETQDSLFGSKEIASPLFLERSKILDNASKHLKMLGKVFKTAIDSEKVLAEAGNVLDSAANASTLTENQRLALALEKLSQRKGPISDALSEQARKLNAGKITVGQARQAFLEALGQPDSGAGGAKLPVGGSGDRPAGKAAEVADGGRKDVADGSLQKSVPDGEASGKIQRAADRRAVLSDDARGRGASRGKDATAVSELTELKPKVQTLGVFAKERGLTITADVDAHIHAGLRSKPQTKTYDRWNKKTLAELQDARDETGRLYRAAIAAGEIRAPTNTENMEATARGHPDNASTQAAQRVLAKRAARKAANEAATVEQTPEGIQTVVPGAERSAGQAKAASAGRDKAEIAARQQQSKMRRTGQERVEDGEDGLFGEAAPTLKFAKARSVDSVAFKAWFKDSKVVDRRGQPLEVFHGSPDARGLMGPEGRFKTQAQRFGMAVEDAGAFFFTNDRPTAKSYADPQRAWDYQGSEPAVLQAYLSLQNPLVVDNGGERYAGPTPQDKLIGQAMDEGRDGIIIRNTIDTYSIDGKRKADIYIAFRPEQIKSVDNAGTFDPVDPRIRFAKARTPFFSATLRAVESIAQERGNGLQWLAMIRKVPGVKQEELDWLGLPQWLSDRKGITKAEVLEYVRANQVQVKEVTKSDTDSAVADEYEALLEERTRLSAKVESMKDGDSSPEMARINEIYHRLNELDAQNDDPAPKFATYTLPGGQNYRELLITMPPKRSATLPDGYEIVTDSSQPADQRWAVMPPGQMHARPFNGRHATQEAAVQAALDAIPGSTVTRFRSAHWDEPNILAHIRFNERETGGERVLFIEEIQSDWHQAGRRKGYAPAGANAAQIDNQIDSVVAEAIAKTPNKSMTEVWAANPDLRARYDELNARRTAALKGVPDAPLKSTWHETAFRRAVAYATENGFDAVAWTPGEMQAERYDLSKQISRLIYTDDPAAQDVGGRLVALDHGQQEVINRIVKHPADLADIVGKDVATRLLDQEPDQGKFGLQKRELSGLDLKVGGDGMAGFYDKILPSYARKWGKRFGAEVGTVNVTKETGIYFSDARIIPPSESRTGRWTVGIPNREQQYFDSEADARAAMDAMRPRSEVWSMPITPAMRETVQRDGVALFARARGVTFEATPDFIASTAAVARDLARDLGRIAPGVDLSVVRRLFSGGTELSGMFQADGLIAVALDAPGRTAQATLRHEALHALREANLFKPSEWGALTKAARADTVRLGRAQSEYPDLDADGQIEEVIADMYGDWRAGNLPTTRGFIRTAFERVRAFLDALGSALRGNGFTTAESVFRRVESGSVGQRFVQAERSGNNISAAKARPSGVERIEQAAPPPDLVSNEIILADETQRQFLWRKLKDDKNRLYQAQKTVERLSGAKLPESIDAYLVAGLFQTKSASALKKYQATTVSDLLHSVARAIRETKATQQDIDAYLFAHHAPARNKVMAERDPERWSTEPGSGMSNEEAARILAEAKAKGWEAAFERVAQKVYAMLKADVARRAEAGLIDAETVAAWNAMYPDGRYVPFRGFAERNEDDEPQVGSMRTGRGFDIRGPESKEAKGRSSKADSPVAFAIMMGAEGIVRAEKNRIAKTMYRFASLHPTSAVRALGKRPVKKTRDLKTGEMVTVMDDEALRQPNILAAKIGGKPYYMELAPELAVGMKNLGVEQLSKVSQAMRKLTRFWSSMLTSRNPAFFIPNATVDFMTGILTAMQSDAPRGMTRRYLTGYLSAITALWQWNAGIPMTAKWRALIEEWEADGGRMDFYGYQNLDDIKGELERAAAQSARGRIGRVVKGAGPAMFKAVEWMNTPFENAARFASYSAARKLGVSRQKAAMHSLESSGNFAKRGEMTPLIGAWYPFFGASMTGLGQLAGFAKHPATQTVLLGAVIFPMIWAFSAATQYPGDDDPEGLPPYFRIPDWERGRSVIIPRGVIEDEVTNPDGSIRVVQRLDYNLIRIPHALRPFWTLGDQIAAAWLGGVSVGEVFEKTLASAMFNWSPISGTDPVGMMLPLVGDPIYEIGTNRDSLGRQIRPEGYGGAVEGVPAYSWKEGQTSPAFIKAAQAVNTATGGDSVTPGSVLGIPTSVHPDHLEYLWEFLSGGLGRFASEVAQTTQNKLEGVETAPNRIPIIKTTIGRTDARGQTDRFYDLLNEGETLADRLTNTKGKVETGELGDAEWDQVLDLADQMGVTVKAPDKNVVWKGSWLGIMRKARDASNEVRLEIRSIMARTDLSRAEIEEEVKVLRGRQEAIMLTARTQALDIRAYLPTP